MTDDLPKRLKKIRGARKLTQEAVAERAGIRPSALCRFENGVRTPSVNDIKILAVALNVSADYLLGLSLDASPLELRAEPLLNGVGRDDDIDLLKSFIKMLSERADA